MSNYSVIGQRVHNIDGTEKVTGSAKYAFDVVLPNMLYGKVLRSPHPHAKILKIDTRRAKRLVGVKAVVTGKDTLGRKHIRQNHVKGVLGAAGYFFRSVNIMYPLPDY